MKDILSCLLKSPIFIKVIVVILLVTPSRAFASESLGEWKLGPFLPYTIASNVAYQFLSKIYVIGGANFAVIPMNVRSNASPIDGSLVEWVNNSVASPQLFWHASAVKDNYIYILGGDTYPPVIDLNTVYRGNINSSGEITSWTTLTPLPQKLGLGAAVVVGNKLYFGGGRNNNTGTINNLIYVATINSDGTIGNWTVAGNLPIGMYGFSLLTSGNDLLMIGGYYGNTYRATLKSDGTIDSWHAMNSLPYPPFRAEIVKVGSRVFVMGGTDTSYSEFFDKIYYADIGPTGEVGTWTLSSRHLPKPMCCGGVTTANNYIYLIGGHDGSYFNSVYYAKVDTSSSLNVPYFSQNALPWGPTEYDHAKSLGFSDFSMDRWGCAVTSAAMVMNYHGMTKMEDGSDLDPGTLNVWLKNNKGYIEGKGKDGGYAYILWNSIGTLSKKLYDAHKSTVKLMHQRLYPSTNTENVLASDITVNNTPDILQVKNNLTSSHFVVARGIDNNATYLINDPEWGYPNLSSFNNKYYQVDRFIPSHTDLSYMILVVNADQELLVTDSQGKKTGKIVQGNNITEYNEIPNALYQTEDPINNPNTSNSPENLGTAVKSFLLPIPSDGVYAITVSSKTSSIYTLHMIGFTKDGESTDTTLLGSSNPSQTQAYQFSFSSSSPSTVDTPVTFATTLADIKEAYDLNLMNDSTYYVFSSKIKAVQADYVNNRKTMALFKLNEFIAMLDSYRGKSLNEIAYQALMRDGQYLLSHFDSLSLSN